MTVEFTAANFKAEVLDATGPVLVDFWAPWCGPCRMLGPIVEALSKELAGKVTVGKINVDEAQDLAGQYGITSIPTLLLFKGGKVAAKHVGSMPAPKLKEFALS